jgi:hypothetical protein
MLDIIARKLSRPYTSLRTSARWSSPKFLFFRTQFHLRPGPPKAKCAATDREDQTASGRIYSVPSRAKRPNVISADTPVRVSTNLKRDAGNTEDGLCDWIQLQAVNVLLISIWEN